MLRCCFMGTPAFSVPSLRKIIQSGHEISLVVSKPDKPIGRNRKISPTPIKQEALKHSLNIEQPEKVSDPLFINKLENLNLDIGLVVSYGAILPLSVLKIPRYGFINLHPSLLPKYRGPSPLQAALAAGDTVSGITIMRVNEKMDAGPILSQSEEIILPADNLEIFYDRMAEKGADRLCEVLEVFDRTGTCVSVPQKEEDAVYCPKIDDNFSRIDWKWPAEKIVNRAKSLAPRPGLRTSWQGRFFKILKASVFSKVSSGHKSGTIVAHHKNEALEVATVDGSLLVQELQIEGSRKMTAQDFVNGKGSNSVGTSLV
ncbi:methionyl-tRNA formyltransferase [PVC group bacterium (ex Bugula neritina AB1)]|nr:methionyl-tRNA formyltransferase [PVC group bacterium (ex Bugula neritina AB1)]